ncbi:hypothetical protein IFR05_017460, partial [Cadophora sp. M221]
ISFLTRRPNPRPLTRGITPTRLPHERGPLGPRVQTHMSIIDTPHTTAAGTDTTETTPARSAIHAIATDLPLESAQDLLLLLAAQLAAVPVACRGRVPLVLVLLLPGLDAAALLVLFALLAPGEGLSEAQ